MVGKQRTEFFIGILLVGADGIYRDFKKAGDFIIRLSLKRIEDYPAGLRR